MRTVVIVAPERLTCHRVAPGAAKTTCGLTIPGTWSYEDVEIARRIGRPFCERCWPRGSSEAL